MQLKYSQAIREFMCFTFHDLVSFVRKEAFCEIKFTIETQNWKRVKVQCSISNNLNLDALYKGRKFSLLAG